jgi:transcriptional regulator with XRE-family HTH domain
MEQKYFYISAKKLLDARERARVSQSGLAEALQVSRQTLNVWEHKTEIKITPDQARIIAKVLKVSIDDLTEVATTAEEKQSPSGLQGLIDTFNKTFDSKEREVLRLERTVENLEKDKDRLWQHIQELTRGFATLQKAK